MEQNMIFASAVTPPTVAEVAGRPTIVKWDMPPPSGRGNALRLILLGMLWVLLPMAILLSNVQHRSPAWEIPGPPAEARASVTDLPSMIGTWAGRFDVDHSPAILAVTSQDGSSFEGVLVEAARYGTFKVRVHGSLDSSDQVSITETEVLSVPPAGSWALGYDRGELSADGLGAIGTGSDTQGVSYDWSFSHISSSPYIPAE